MHVDVRAFDALDLAVGFRVDDHDILPPPLGACRAGINPVSVGGDAQRQRALDDGPRALVRTVLAEDVEAAPAARDGTQPLLRDLAGDGDIRVQRTPADVGDQESAARVDRHGMDDAKLPGPIAVLADLLQKLPLLVEPDQPRVPVAVGDHDVAVRQDRHAGRPVEVRGVVAVRAVLAERQHRCAVRRQLLHLMPIAIDDPDEAVTVDVDAVRTDERLILRELTEKRPVPIEHPDGALAAIPGHRQGMRRPVVHVARDRVDDAAGIHGDAGAHLERRAGRVAGPVLDKAISTVGLLRRREVANGPRCDERGEGKPNPNECCGCRLLSSHVCLS